MKRSVPSHLEGTFLHPVYSPRGEIEGLIIQTKGVAAQVVLQRDDEVTPIAVQGLREGQVLSIEAEPAAPSPKGKSDHPVHELRKLIAIDGKAPVEAVGQSDAGYQGSVLRFNYARHGEINGVVLDTGDFLHLKPAGYARLGLKIGDHVEAEGDAQQLVDGRGWAVEVAHIRANAR